MDGHGDGRLKRSGTKWNETKKSVTVTSRDGHGHATFSVKNERFTVKKNKNLILLVRVFGITLNPFNLLFRFFNE